MKCPTCTNTDLVMSERQGVEIDYCPQCRGIWLDRGEMDKIIDMVIAGEKANQPAPPQQTYYKDDKYHEQHKYHRKKHWLNDLFD